MLLAVISLMALAVPVLLWLRHRQDQAWLRELQYYRQTGLPKPVEAEAEPEASISSQPAFFYIDSHPRIAPEAMPQTDSTPYSKPDDDAAIPAAHANHVSLENQSIANNLERNPDATNHFGRIPSLAAKQRDLPRETITLNDPSVHRIRERSSADTHEVQTNHGNLSVPKPVHAPKDDATKPLQTIEIEDIRANLLRQRADFRRDVPPSDAPRPARVIAEAEVFANLVHTDSPLNRRGSKLNRITPGDSVIPPAVRVQHSHGSVVRPAAPVHLPDTHFDAPEIMQAAAAFPCDDSTVHDAEKIGSSLRQHRRNRLQ